jgi:TPP-dependent pyruvate/acetoin dehydrogenase alpha subunit
VPLHFPEHEAVEVFGAPEEYEAAKRGDPVPRMRGVLVGNGTLSPAEAGQIADSARAEMREAVEFALQSPFPSPEEAVKFVYA